MQILLGPRQCGKSTLFAALMIDQPFHEITFDDLQLRRLAEQDPALLLQQFDFPLLLDEIQYVSNLFPELKKIIDQHKRRAALTSQAFTQPKILFRVTGSNQILLDKQVKESLAGRASYYFLNTLTVHEIVAALPHTKITQILFQGGWPELYTNPQLSPITYLNDYIRSYVEKDIVISTGIQKLTEFHTVLGLLAGRTGLLTDYSAIAKNSGVRSVTVKEWTTFLERADLVYLLKPYHSNLNKRLIKTPKLYFLDTGLATRLQGWSDPLTLFSSPQIGALFETLVFAEILKFIRNYNKDWQLFFWRSKEGEEVDFILKTAEGGIHGFEVKLSLQSTSQAVHYPKALTKELSPHKPLVIVTAGNRRLQLSKDCLLLPITELHDYLSLL